MTELPLGGAARNINNLILQSPNVSASTGQGTYSVNGQRSRNNNFMIDGSDNNDISVTIATSQIVPESVAEFQVLTNPFNVEFGRNSGAQVNVITKSGSNSFRGEGWEYYQDNKRWSSLTNIQKDSGLTKSPQFKRHQFGVDIGGPIVNDKTFFFLLYQRELQRPEERPGPNTIRIPTAEGFAALQNVPLRAGQPAGSRQAVLQRLQFLQPYYSTGLVFRNPTNVLVNGVNIATGQVNIPIVEQADLEVLGPFIPLAAKLGRLASALLGGRPRHIVVAAHGPLSEFDTRLLTVAALNGVFQGRVDHVVNYVNAPVIAAERGIEVTEQRLGSSQHYTNLVRVVVGSEDEDVEVSGTTVGPEHRLFLAGALGYAIDIELAPEMAFLVYDDMPGVIGRVGTMFGEAGVNIANMAVSRTKEGGKALMAFSIDAAAPAELVERVRGFGFDAARFISLG